MERVIEVIFISLPTGDKGRQILIAVEGETLARGQDE